MYILPAETEEQSYFLTPAQLCPSPLNPGLQKQLNNPSVFVQVALSLLQLWVSRANSSMSEIKST